MTDTQLSCLLSDHAVGLSIGNAAGLTPVDYLVHLAAIEGLFLMQIGVARAFVCFEERRVARQWMHLWIDDWAWGFDSRDCCFGGLPVVDSSYLRWRDALLSVL